MDTAPGRIPEARINAVHTSECSVLKFVFRFGSNFEVQCSTFALGCRERLRQLPVELEHEPRSENLEV